VIGPKTQFGRRLPDPMWTVMRQRLADAGDGWNRDVEPVPLALATCARVGRVGMVVMLASGCHGDMVVAMRRQMNRWSIEHDTPL